MKSSEYWAKRFVQLNEALFRQSAGAARDLEREYQKAAAAIEKDIELWLLRIADNNQVSLSEAKRMLKGRELDEFRWTVAEYIAKGEANALHGGWMKQLENASARAHISRYEAMLLQIRHNLEMLAASQNKSMLELSADLLTQGYYQTIFEVQKGMGQGAAFATLNPKLINTIAAKPWALDGKNFSERIWDSKEKLINELESNLTQAFIRGEAPVKTIAAISDRLGVSKRQAGRLVMTEAAYFSAEGQKRAYQELDVDRYEIVATLDSKTSEICQELDGKVLEMKDYRAGVTAPPFHCWCRTVTAPYFEDNYTERAARGANGKVYYVDGDMTYREWYNKHVKSAETPKTRKTGDSPLKEPLRYKHENSWRFIPSETSISDNTVIAGAGVKDSIRDIDRLIIQYGGDSVEWMKVAGKIESDLYVFDVHWYQKADGIHYDEIVKKKVKRK